MRRHLLLVRHAKSAWDDPTLADHDRPLAPRGVRAARLLHDHLARAEHRPEIVLCSSARRTVDTLAGVRAALPAGVRIEVDEVLYLATADALVARLQRVATDVRCAMVVGHNPGMQDLSLLLAGDGDGDLRAQLEAKLPTGAAVTLSFDGDWDALAAGVARIEDLFLPRPPRS